MEKKFEFSDGSILEIDLNESLVLHIANHFNVSPPQVDDLLIKKFFVKAFQRLQNTIEDVHLDS